MDSQQKDRILNVIGHQESMRLPHDNEGNVIWSDVRTLASCAARLDSRIASAHETIAACQPLLALVREEAKRLATAINER